MRARAVVAVVVAAGCMAPATAAAGPAVRARAAADAPPVPFNGRISFSSFRTSETGAVGDIFSLNADGTGLRQLSTDPRNDAQSDWSPDGRDLVYRIARPDSDVGLEVARMPAAGGEREVLTSTPEPDSSTQPSWFPDGSGILFRRSTSGNRIASIWSMGLHGEDPVLRFDPDGPQWYPAFSPDMRRVLFATTMSPDDDSDRGVFTMNADGTGLTALFDVAGAFDSAPAWSPDGSRIAFQSTADVAGGNPEGDSEIWVMDADGSDPVQLTFNALHDEGPAWSPDGTMFVYTSGADDLHGDIHVITAGGAHLLQLTDYAGRDESPDWQAIPAPADAGERCPDVVATGPGVHDVRAGRVVTCADAVRLAARWYAKGMPRFLRWYRAQVEEFGGTLRVELRLRRRPHALAAAFVVWR